MYHMKIRIKGGLGDNEKQRQSEPIWRSMQGLALAKLRGLDELVGSLDKPLLRGVTGRFIVLSFNQD